MQNYSPPVFNPLTDLRNPYIPANKWCSTPLDLWDPGAVEEGRGIPKLYLHPYDGWETSFQPSEHYSLFASKARLYTYLYIAGHTFSRFETLKDGLVKIMQPLWIDNHNWRFQLRELQESGYIKMKLVGEEIYAAVTDKLPLSRTPSERPEHDFRIELNRRFWTLFYDNGHVLDLLLWLGLHRRVSNGIVFVEFAAGEIPGYSRHAVRKTFQFLCDIQLMKNVTDDGFDLIDDLSIRSPMNGRQFVGNGLVALMRDFPVTCVPTSPFPTPQPDLPNLRFLRIGNYRRPQMIHPNLAVPVDFINETQTPRAI